MLEALLKLEELQAPAMLGFVQDVLAGIHRRNNYLGPTLLPARRVDDLRYEYIVGADNIPVAAHVVQFDSPSPTGRRLGALTRVTGELLTAKYKLSLKPSELQAIQRALASGVDVEVKNALRAIFDDAERILAALAARVELMRWQALTTGKVVYTSADLNVELDYGLPAGNVFEAEVKWDQPDAKPLSDLMRVCDYMAETYGVRPARAVIHTKNWNELLRSEEARLWVHGATQVGGVPTRPVTSAELRTLLTALELPAFAIYDVKVQVEDPVTGALTEQFLLPEDTVVLLPPSNVELGWTLFGPTPTEVLNVAGYGDALKQMTEAPRYVVRVYAEGNDTPTVWTLGEVTAAPAIPGIKYVAILKV